MTVDHLKMLHAAGGKGTSRIPQKDYLLLYLSFWKLSLGAWQVRKKKNFGSHQTKYNKHSTKVFHVNEEIITVNGSGGFDYFLFHPPRATGSLIDAAFAPELTRSVYACSSGDRLNKSAVFFPPPPLRLF